MAGFTTLIENKVFGLDHREQSQDVLVANITRVLKAYTLTVYNLLNVGNSRQTRGICQVRIPRSKQLILSNF